MGEEPANVEWTGKWGAVLHQKLRVNDVTGTGIVAAQSAPCQLVWGPFLQCTAHTLGRSQYGDWILLSPPGKCQHLELLPVNHFCILLVYCCALYLWNVNHIVCISHSPPFSTQLERVVYWKEGSGIRPLYTAAGINWCKPNKRLCWCLLCDQLI